MSLRMVKKEIRAGVGADGTFTDWHFVADRFWMDENGNEQLLPPTTIPLTDGEVSALMGHAYSELQKVAAAHAETVVVERAAKEAAEKDREREKLDADEKRAENVRLKAVLEQTIAEAVDLAKKA